MRIKVIVFNFSVVFWDTVMYVVWYTDIQYHSTVTLTKNVRTMLTRLQYRPVVVYT